MSFDEDFNPEASKSNKFTLHQFHTRLRIHIRQTRPVAVAGYRPKMIIYIKYYLIIHLILIANDFSNISKNYLLILFVVETLFRIVVKSSLFILVVVESVVVKSIVVETVFLFVFLIVIKSFFVVVVKSFVVESVLFLN